MKILFVIQGMQNGGAERVMSLLCNKLVERGHNVHLGLTERISGIAYELDNRVKILDLRCNCNNTMDFFLKSSKVIRSAIEANKPDVVVSFITRANICTLLGGFGKRVPIIISERNNPQIDPPSKITRFIRRIVYPFASGYVFQTDFAKKCFSKSIQKKGVVIYNPIDETKLQLTNKERMKRIISVGRLEEQKNFPLLINAFAEAHCINKGYTLVIYGEGSLRNTLQKQIEEKGLNNFVTLKGQTNNPFAELAASKIFVLSSNYEGMPNALMEAMCMGCACISTDSPAYGARELIENGVNGFLVPVGDLTALVSRLSQLMENDDLQNSIGAKATMIANRVNSDVIVKQWLHFIEKTIRK